MSNLQTEISNSILKGVNYLQQHQYPNGEFCCYIGHEDSMKDTIPDATNFPTSLICSSLLNLAYLPQVENILQLSGSFLQFQSMRGGAWNNFTMAHKYFKICPACVDNTACASIFLKAIKRDYQKNEELLLLNRNKSGLFYTWFTFRPNTAKSKEYWLLLLREFKFPLSTFLFWTKNEANKNDIDGAVNANVLLYLGLRPETVPVIQFMLNIIEQYKEDDCDKWYRNPFTIYYFFSRPFNAGIQELNPICEPITQRVLATLKEDGSLGNSVLDTALGICTLINLNYKGLEIQKATKYLLSEQKENGEWARWALYYGGPKKHQCYGSEEITTAFCLEALALYQQREKVTNENT